MARPKLTTPTPRLLAQSPLRRLIPVVDKARDLATRLGVRPYAVRLVSTRWSGGYRGQGVEVLEAAVDILPTPRLVAIDALTRSPSKIGLLEAGIIELQSISGDYTEDQLTGLTDGGQADDPAVQVWWEIEFIRADGGPSLRRRFTPSSAPYYDAAALGWRVQLQFAHEARDGQGALRN